MIDDSLQLRAVRILCKLKCTDITISIPSIMEILGRFKFQDIYKFAFFASLSRRYIWEFRNTYQRESEFEKLRVQVKNVS